MLEIRSARSKILGAQTRSLEPPLGLSTIKLYTMIVKVTHVIFVANASRTGLILMLM